MRDQWRLRTCTLVVAATFVVWHTPVSGTEPAARSVADLSLEELMNIQVVSGSKKLQRIADSASAVFVITAEDIRRSGVTSIPEALRMAPGVEVARFGSNKWAVSIRGFNGRFANKLLVLMDGRTLYTPLFAGVQWELHDTVLEDIERIEVIRGPGAALWGANAVNGVINIITRRAQDTQSALLSAGAGTAERAFGVARFGGSIGEEGAYRVYAKGFARDRFPDAIGQEGRDDWNAGSVGFRIDRALGSGDDLLVQGQAFSGRVGERLVSGRLLPPFQATEDIDQKNKGAHLLLRWEGGGRTRSATTVQGFVDHAEYHLGSLVEKRQTLDLELQRRTPWGAAHDLVFGLGYRFSRDDIASIETIAIAPENRSTHLWSAFVQDEWALIPERVRLTLGARLEHNSYTGREIQPSARLLWTPSPTQSLWGSVARAVRTPSRAEADGRIRREVLPPLTAANPTPLPVELALTGGREFDSERLHAFEVGYRNQITPRMSVDMTLFHNRYEGIRSFTMGATQLQLLAVPPHAVVPVPIGNAGSGRVRGVEVSAEVRPTDGWRLSGFLARQWLDFSGATGPDTQLEGSSPRHTVSLRSTTSLSRGVEFDLWLRHVDSLPAFSVPSYTSVDARLGWKINRNLDVALIGQNLLDSRRSEFVPDFVGTATYQVPRGAYVKVDWKF